MRFISPGHTPRVEFPALAEPRISVEGSEASAKTVLLRSLRSALKEPFESV
jgi:hypothetical protein